MAFDVAPLVNADAGVLLGRIMDGRERRGGLDRHDYLLSAEELQQIRDARVHPSRRSED